MDSKILSSRTYHALVLAMAFMEDTGPDGVKLSHGGAADVTNDRVKKKDKMENSLFTKVEKVKTGN